MKNFSKNSCRRLGGSLVSDSAVAYRCRPRRSALRPLGRQCGVWRGTTSPSLGHRPQGFYVAVYMLRCPLRGLAVNVGRSFRCVAFMVVATNPGGLPSHGFESVSLLGALGPRPQRGAFPDEARYPGRIFIKIGVVCPGDDPFHDVMKSGV